MFVAALQEKPIPHFPAIQLPGLEVPSGHVPKKVRFYNLGFDCILREKDKIHSKSNSAGP